MRPQEPPASQRCSRIPAISITPKSFLAAILSFACIVSLGVDLPASAAIPAAAKDKKTKQDPSLKGLPITELTPDEAILHALNRLAYGPRPGDVERIRQMGLAKWIDQQLNPNSIDDKAMEARLQNYPTLKMSAAKLIDEYPQPKQAAKQAGLTKEEFKREQAEKRRAEAATDTAARDMQAGQGQAATGAEAGAPQQSGDNSQAKQEMSDAPAPMKQEPPGRMLQRTGQGSAMCSAEATPTMCHVPLPTIASGRNALWPNSPWPKLAARSIASGNSSRSWTTFGLTTSTFLPAKAKTATTSPLTNVTSSSRTPWGSSRTWSRRRRRARRCFSIWTIS